jgi:hypothetical protein
LKAHAEKRTEVEFYISSATEAVLLQISNREKVSLLQAGINPMRNKTVIDIFKKLSQFDHYEPVNIYTILPTNHCSRSSIIHRDLPQQSPQRIVLWTFDNGSTAPQQNKLKSNLQKMQKFYYPREFY